MYIADFHIHSKYSRATSKDCEPQTLDYWARAKGLDVIGTGDFTHAAWRRELREKLQPAPEEGLYVLKEELRLLGYSNGDQKKTRFIMSGEISSIYKKNGKTRKVHNLILLPGLEAADRLSAKLEAIGNLHSDGRPILGLDSRDLLEITLEACPQAIFIPAHIWTPHFSLFGAYSGFDDITECFEDLSYNIHALETGLSSDPPMNWRWSALDNFLLISNSDAHSPGKLAREANLFETELSYPAIAKALSDKNAPGFCGTLEFFPEEGKYHFDGHRKCGVCLKPQETIASGAVCPICGGKITIGVLHRVESLSDRPEGFQLANAPNFESLVPLLEVIKASCGLTGVKAQRLYEHLLRTLGAELTILRKTPIDELERRGGAFLSEGIRKLRGGDIRLLPGYDGEYGEVQILNDRQREAMSGQINLFGEAEEMLKQKKQRAKAGLVTAKPTTRAMPTALVSTPGVIGANTASDSLNDAQKQAAHSPSDVTAIIAGPGTGKTKTLISRIAFLIDERAVPPERITAVTFTNKAATEMRNRLEQILGRRARKTTIGTFHALCLAYLSKRGVCTRNIIDEASALFVVTDILQELDEKISARDALRQISRIKNGSPSTLPQEIRTLYDARLAAANVMDYDDILLIALSLWRTTDEKDESLFCLLVDEFQDVNPVQYELIRVWRQRGGSLFVIGDPHQSIYGFRGACADCFNWLTRDFPQSKRHALTQNYRSDKEIISCANWLTPRPELLKATLLAKTKVRLIQVSDAFSEARFVAGEIARLVGGVDMLTSAAAPNCRAFSDMAIAVRTNRQADVLEQSLIKEGIPYAVSGKERFLQERETAAAIAFFRLALNSDDPITFSLYQKFCGRDRLEIEKMLNKYASRIGEKNPAELLRMWAEENAVTQETPALRKLCEMAVLHDDMRVFLNTLLIGGEADFIRSTAKRRQKNVVALTTLHAAKGLEYPVVFLCGLSKGVLPHVRKGESDTEEERRLLYVGITRAREELILLTYGEESPFLRNISKESFIQYENIFHKMLPNARRYEQSKLF